MAFRAYLLASLDPSCDGDARVRLVSELEAMDVVSFAEPVVGAYDLVITAETNGPVEQLVGRVTQLPGIVRVVALKANPIPARQRMWKNLTGIPLSRPS